MALIPEPPPPWWEDMTQYTIDSSDPFPNDTSSTGPKDVATVFVYGNGTTQPGWGLTGKKQDDGTFAPGFMELYDQLKFAPSVTNRRYKLGHPFAFIMRSLQMICVDIDGKNGGFDSTLKLGELPPTLAEKSKSGNGVHLFYRTDELWDPATGFGEFADTIGLVQGIDIRSVGCVYHYASQRWNDLPLAPIPDQLREMLVAKEKRRQTRRANRLVALVITDDMEEDDMEEDDIMATLLKKEELLAELDKVTATAGSRNNTLFAIGSGLRELGVTGWEEKILAKAEEVGLPEDEADKLVRNIESYGSR